jgi:hypothetical protein
MARHQERAEKTKSQDKRIKLGMRRESDARVVESR